MPRFSRKSRRRTEADEENIIHHLECGSCVGCLIRPPICTVTEEMLRDAWPKHKAAILKKWVEENREGNPWGWNRFEARDE